MLLQFVLPARCGGRPRTTESGGAYGYDAGKKIKGRKRHILTDTNGFMVGFIVHSAAIQDRDGAVPVLQSIGRFYPFLRHDFADGGYAGDKLKQALKGKGEWTIEAIKRFDKEKNSTFYRADGSWSALSRGSADIAVWRKDWEATTQSATAWTLVANIRIMMRRMAEHCYIYDRVSNQALGLNSKANSAFP